MGRFRSMLVILEELEQLIALELQLTNKIEFVLLLL